MKSTRFIRAARANALSRFRIEIPPFIPAETIAMAGIVSRDLETEEEEVARRQSARHVSLKREKKKERRRRGRREETVDSHREILDTLPSTRRLKLLRSARDDRCLVSSFTPLGSGNRSCLANVSSAETIFLAAALLLFFER